jgi:hypothetical protein
MPENVNKFIAIIEYFETIARQHVSILHTSTQKHFFRLELDELVIGITSSATRYPVLVLESYTFKLEDNKSDYPLRVRSCAFMVLDKVLDKGNFMKIHEVYDRMEEITDDIIARLKQDKRTPGSPFRDLDINSIEGTLISFDSNSLHGIRINFDIKSPVNLNVNPAKWNNNG